MPAVIRRSEGSVEELFYSFPAVAVFAEADELLYGEGIVFEVYVVAAGEGHPSGFAASGEPVMPHKEIFCGIFHAGAVGFEEFCDAVFFGHIIKELVVQCVDCLF